MNITIEPIKNEEKEILRNLLEKYQYEFSQYDNNDVNNIGLFGYNYLDYYWTEKNRFPFFIKVDEKLAGFVLINDFPEIKRMETNYSIAEFFVLFKYRRQGVGKYALNYVLNKFKGKWQLRFHPKNVISKNFWIKAIDGYTKGNYETIKDDPETIYEDGTIGYILIFET